MSSSIAEGVLEDLIVFLDKAKALGNKSIPIDLLLCHIDASEQSLREKAEQWKEEQKK